MKIGEITQLWRYPVKSFLGEAVTSLELGTDHVEGDRQWALVDTETGKLLSAKRWGALLEASARSEGGEVIITLPTGAELGVGDPTVDAALSDWLDRPIHLTSAAAGSLPYELYADATDDSSELFDFPSPAGHFADLASTHLLTTASLAAAAALYPEGDWDVRRFRPTALIEVDGEGFVEDAWVGQTVGLGAQATTTPFMPTIRCSMPPRAQPGLDRDVGIARTLTDHHQSNLGVYCGPGAAGTVSVGDPVTLVDPS